MTTLRISHFKHDGECIYTSQNSFETMEDAIKFINDLYPRIKNSYLSYQFTLTEMNGDPNYDL